MNTKLLGHSGNGMAQWNGMFEANSLEGVKYALNLTGCAGIEIDVRLSKDTTFWLIHDEEISSLTNSSGCVIELTDEELESVRYKSFKKEKLVRLSEIIELNTNKTIVLDLKNTIDCSASYYNAEFIKSGFSKLGTLPVNFQINFNSSYLYPYLKDTGIPLIFEITDVQKAAFAYDKPEIVGFMFDAATINADEVRMLHEKNYSVYFYGVRAVKRLKQELKKRPDYILVDDLLNSVMEL